MDPRTPARAALTIKEKKEEVIRCKRGGEETNGSSRASHIESRTRKGGFGLLTEALFFRLTRRVSGGEQWGGKAGGDGFFTRCFSLRRQWGPSGLASVGNVR